MGSSNKQPPAAEKKRKKKGRPSLLDLQKRSLRLQKQQEEKEKTKNPNPSPNPYLRFPASSSSRRITRRHPQPDPLDAAAEEEDDEDEAESSGWKRREKKLKLVLRLPPDRSANSNSASDSDADAAGATRRKRKIDAVVSDGDRDKAERRNSSKAMDSLQGEPSDSGPTTLLPDKKLLVFILDRLQKKDTYGVFSEPVDPEELPDYHEVIEHPMDFGTVRKRLSSGAYANLEQFEKDVFLISSNAMRYNAPDTIYYRQARSIHEIAKKSFENLRQESDDNEPEPKTVVVRRGRPPNKNKRPVGRPPERATSDFSSDATLANAGDATQCSNISHDLSRKGSLVDKFGMMTSYGLRNTDTFSWMGEQKSERNEELSAFKGIATKYGKKLTVIDENRRNTYKQPQQFTSVHEPPVLTTFDGEKKHLVPVGLHMEYSYLRSLARFAANLGPIGWAIAAKKIERALPPGTKFGRGWVGDADAPQQPQPPLLSTSPPHPSSQPKILPCTTISRSDKQPSRLERPSNNSAVEEAHFRTTSASPSAASNRPPEIMEGPMPSRGSNCENGRSALSGVGGGDANRSKVPFQLHQNLGMQTTMNGFNNMFNMPSQSGKMVRPARPLGSFGSDVQMTHALALDMVSRSSNSLIHQTSTGLLHVERAKATADDSNTINSGNSLQGSGLNSQGPRRGASLQPKSDSVPPDLNVGFQSPGSPTSGVLVDSQQPDLALQL